MSRLNDLIREIKYAYQRVRFGYDETILWEFDSYFMKFLDPLKKFCKDQLADKGLMKGNPKRKEVFTETLRLIDDWEKYEYANNGFDIIKLQKKYSDIWKYFGEYIGIYWD